MGHGNNHSKDRQMRLRIAQEAARLMLEGGIKDFYIAKRKAAEHLGAPDTRNMPRNQEIQAARQEYQRLFQSHRQPDDLRRLRRAALQAMQFLADFQPLLVGSVLEGSAGAHSDVNLHLFCEQPEEVGLFLARHRVPFTERDRRLRYTKEVYRTLPVYAFVAGDIPVELTVFPLDGQRQPPLSPVDGRRLRRASMATVQQLLEEEEATG
jgi:predicted nucleotidyltransferase